jgi:hypothetical protein
MSQPARIYLLPPTTLNLVDLELESADEDNPIDEISRIEAQLEERADLDLCRRRQCDGHCVKTPCINDVHPEGINSLPINGVVCVRLAPLARRALVKRSPPFIGIPTAEKVAVGLGDAGNPI